MSPSHIICCLTGKHARSRKHAKVGPDRHLRSECTRCGEPLIRTYSRDGRVGRVDRRNVRPPRSRIDASDKRGPPPEHSDR